ncbi:hypothetical protein FNF07_10635 [Trinickia caryophylli]|nr:hypothetical protein C0Z17_10795 [Trinickia caryophylli]TRX18630.1 hypothetical protein FNF07_10635 [Trinickia caryophylli]
MSYWRKLFIVVLLALSLPAQSSTAAPMKCITAQADAGEAATAHVEHDRSEHHLRIYDPALAVDAPRQTDCHGHHAHSCSACSACCLGTALPVGAIIVVSSDATHVATSAQPCAGVVSFLTGGIERPPRSTLV